MCKGVLAVLLVSIIAAYFTVRQDRDAVGHGYIDRLASIRRYAPSEALSNQFLVRVEEVLRERTLNVVYNNADNYTSPEAQANFIRHELEDNKSVPVFRNMKSALLIECWNVELGIMTDRLFLAPKCFYLYKASP